jgi:hypothetical protein
MDLVSKFTWSYSKLKAYETCPKRFFHYDIIKDIEEIESGALREGHDMHKAFEMRVRDGVKLPLPYVHHEVTLAKLIDSPGETYAEQKLGLTADFKPAGFFSPNVWFRTVIDFCKIRETSAVVVDYKSGKVTDDETQLALMAATLFHYTPSLDEVKTALLFANRDKIISRTFNRPGLNAIWSGILPRVDKLEAAMAREEYPPKPSGLCVKYCGVTSCPHHGTGSRW